MEMYVKVSTMIFWLTIVCIILKTHNFWIVVSASRSSIRYDKNKIIWRCTLYEKAWGTDDITIHLGDFCSKRGLVRDINPEFPSCNVQMFPVVTFFYSDSFGSNLKKCKVKMKLGRKSKENINCINRVVGLNANLNEKEHWLIYASHGLFRADPSERYNRTSFGSVGKLRGYHKEQLHWVKLLKNNFVNIFMNR